LLEDVGSQLLIRRGSEPYLMALLSLVQVVQSLVAALALVPVRLVARSSS